MAPSKALRRFRLDAPASFSIEPAFLCDRVTFSMFRANRCQDLEVRGIERRLTDHAFKTL
jgi:hypothetical protein